MYAMKETCEKVAMTYETLKFHCNQGLIPNVKRDDKNHRVFDDKDISWIQSLSCLKRCGMSIHEMKEYLALCLEGEASRQKRKIILEQKRSLLLQSADEINKSIDYIDWKQPAIC